MTFGTDWPGVFIRGDNAGAYALALQDALELDPNNFELRSLLNTLQSCIEPLQAPAQELRPFPQCLPTISPLKATEALLQAGLHARLNDDLSIIGGSHRTSEAEVNIVHNGFILRPTNDGLYTFSNEALHESPPMTLKEALNKALQYALPLKP
jgi:hypothetical protein